MRCRPALALLLFAVACRPPLQSTRALLLFSQNHRLFLRADCEPIRGPCVPGPAIDAIAYLGQRYQNYRRSGYIDLDPDMRLRVIAPIMRSGSNGIALEPSEVSATSAENITIEGRAWKDLLGYETGIYTLVPADNGVVLKLNSLEAKPVSGSGSDLQTTDYLQPRSDSPDVLRLYFQLRRSDFDHDSALLVANSSAALEQASTRFETNPNSICGSRQSAGEDVQCFAPPHQVAMIAELGIRVQDRIVYVPVESSLQTALRAYGEQDPKRLIPSLRVFRRVGAREIPIRFNKDSDEILRLPVAGGDRIEC